MLQTKVAEKIKTYFMSNNSFFENRVFYEMMWKNMAEQYRPQMKMKYSACALHAG
jgi:hypothetical protein